VLDTQGDASQNLRAGRAGTVFGRQAKRVSPSESANFPLGNLTRVLGGISLCVFALFLAVTAFGQDQLFYETGESIDLKERGFVAAHVKARIEWGTVSGNDEEIIYRPRKKKVLFRDVELKDQKMRFHRAGDYLVEFIRENQTKDIQRIKIVRQTAHDPLSTLFKDIHLYAFRDSFYKTIYHLELRFTPPLKRDLGSLFHVLWQIDGGRYHVLDEELPYFSKIRIFQKSIVLKEFKTYEITASLSLNDGQTFEKRVTIDLQPEFQQSPLLLPDQRGLQFGVNQPIHLTVPEEMPIAALDQYAWVVKAVRRLDCPQEWLEFENAKDPAVRGVLHYICDNGYEEELAKNRDFMLPTQKMSEAEIFFKKPGEYEVDLVLFDAGGKAYSRSSKRLILYDEKN